MLITLTQEVLHNQVVILNAGLAEGTPSKLASALKLEKVELLFGEKIVRGLNASKESTNWVSYAVFGNTDIPGAYQVHWIFSINGQILDRYEHITLVDPKNIQVSVEGLVISVNETWEQCEEKSRAYIKSKKPHLKGTELEAEIKKLCGFIRQRGMSSAPIEDPDTIPPEILLMLKEPK